MISMDTRNAVIQPEMNVEGQLCSRVLQYFAFSRIPPMIHKEVQSITFEKFDSTYFVFPSRPSITDWKPTKKYKNWKMCWTCDRIVSCNTCRQVSSMRLVLL